MYLCYQAWGPAIPFGNNDEQHAFGADDELNIYGQTGPAKSLLHRLAHSFVGQPVANIRSARTAIQKAQYEGDAVLQV